SAACRLLKDWSQLTGVPTIWLRPFTIYGPGQAGSMLIPYAIRQGLQKIPAHFSAGTQKRDFVFVDDVINALVQSLERLKEGPKTHEVYNLGSGAPIAIRDLVNQLADRLDAKHLFNFGEVSQRLGEPDIVGANTTRAAQQLGWK